MCHRPSAADSQANEKVVNQLKAALDDQEQVMQMQDSHIKTQEADVTALTDKHDALLREHADCTSRLLALEQTSRKAERTEASMTSALDDVRQLKEKVAALERHNAELMTKRETADGDVKEMEGKLAETRREREALRRELESAHSEQDSLRRARDQLQSTQQSRSQADLLKTKFVVSVQQGERLFCR